MRSIKFDTLQPKPETIRPRPSREIIAQPAPTPAPPTPPAPQTTK